MRIFTVFPMVVLMLLLGSSMIAMAGATATQTVTYSVLPINELSVSGDPTPLTVSTAAAGYTPNAVSNASTNYAVTTNMTQQDYRGS